MLRSQVRQERVGERAMGVRRHRGDEDVAGAERLGRVGGDAASVAVPSPPVPVRRTSLVARSGSIAAACAGASHSTTSWPSKASFAAIESPVLLAPRTTTALPMAAKDRTTVPWPAGCIPNVSQMG